MRERESWRVRERGLEGGLERRVVWIVREEEERRGRDRERLGQMGR